MHEEQTTGKRERKKEIEKREKGRE